MDGAKLKLSQLECIRCHSVAYLAFKGADRQTEPVSTYNVRLHLLLGVFPRLLRIVRLQIPIW